MGSPSYRPVHAFFFTQSTCVCAGMHMCHHVYCPYMHVFIPICDGASVLSGLLVRLQGLLSHFLWGVGGVLNKEALSCPLEPAGWKLVAACPPHWSCRPARIKVLLLSFWSLLKDKTKSQNKTQCISWIPEYNCRKVLAQQPGLMPLNEKQGCWYIST